LEPAQFGVRGTSQIATGKHPGSKKSSARVLRVLSAFTSETGNDVRHATQTAEGQTVTCIHVRNAGEYFAREVVLPKTTLLGVEKEISEDLVAATNDTKGTEINVAIEGPEIQVTVYSSSIFYRERWRT
jgi:hypothetical protein